MSEKPLTIEKILSILTETPSRIVGITANLTPTQLHMSPAPDEWSANEVLAHLRSCADVWGSYINRIIAEDRPSIRAVSPRTYIKKTDYPKQEFQPSLQVFTRQRRDLLTVLESLSPEGWARSATVTAVGSPLEKTVQSYAERMARHERGHIRQFQKTVNTLKSQ
jgi:hypothetical protein